MANELMNPQDLRFYAENIVRAGFCGFTDPSQVVTLALVAADEGRNIGAVARDYHVIKGRPTLKADAMLARFQQAGGKVRWKKYTETECTAVFSHEQGGEVEITWTLDMAKKCGLTANDTWRKYPRSMLRARCISEGIRTCFPAVICGVYTPEEAEDMEAEKREAERERVRAGAVNAPQAEAPKAAAAPRPQPKGTPEEQEKAFLAALDSLEKEDPASFSAGLERIGVGDPSAIPQEERNHFFRQLRAVMKEIAAEPPKPEPETEADELDKADFEDAEIVK